MSRLFPTTTFPDTSVPTVNDLEREIDRIEDENLNLKLRIQQLEGENIAGDGFPNPPGTPAEYLQLMDAATDSMPGTPQEVRKSTPIDPVQTVASPVARRADALVVAQEEIGKLQAEAADLRETSSLLLAEVNEKCEEVERLRRACELLQAREESGMQKIEDLQAAREADREELAATASAEISRLRDQVDQLQATQKRAEDNARESEEVITTLREEIANLRAQLLESSRGRAGDLLRISELEPHRSELTEEVVRLTKENQLLRDEIARLQKELKLLRKKAEKSDSESEKYRKLAAEQATLQDRSEQLVASLRRQLEQREKDVELLHDQMRAWDARDMSIRANSIGDQKRIAKQSVQQELRSMASNTFSDSKSVGVSATPTQPSLDVAEPPAPSATNTLAGRHVETATSPIQEHPSLHADHSSLHRYVSGNPGDERSLEIEYGRCSPLQAEIEHGSPWVHATGGVNGGDESKRPESCEGFNTRSRRQQRTSRVESPRERGLERRDEALDRQRVWSSKAAASASVFPSDNDRWLQGQAATDVEVGLGGLPVRERMSGRERETASVRLRESRRERQGREGEESNTDGRRAIGAAESQREGGARGRRGSAESFESQGRGGEEGSGRGASGGLSAEVAMWRMRCMKLEEKGRTASKLIERLEERLQGDSARLAARGFGARSKADGSALVARRAIADPPVSMKLRVDSSSSRSRSEVSVGRTGPEGPAPPSGSGMSSVRSESLSRSRRVGADAAWAAAGAYAGVAAGVDRTRQEHEYTERESSTSVGGAGLANGYVAGMSRGGRREREDGEYGVLVAVGSPSSIAASASRAGVVRTTAESASASQRERHSEPVEVAGSGSMAGVDVSDEWHRKRAEDAPWRVAEAPAGHTNSVQTQTASAVITKVVFGGASEAASRTPPDLSPPDVLLQEARRPEGEGCLTRDVLFESTARASSRTSLYGSERLLGAPSSVTPKTYIARSPPSSSREPSLSASEARRVLSDSRRYSPSPGPSSQGVRAGERGIDEGLAGALSRWKEREHARASAADRQIASLLR